MKKSKKNIIETTKKYKLSLLNIKFRSIDL
jgi:hypothetical protein